MSEVRLNEREQLIERVLRMPNDQVEAYAKFLNAIFLRISLSPQPPSADILLWLNRIVDEMDEELEDEFDHAIIQARKGEPGRPFDDFVKELGFTQEEITASSIPSMTTL